MAKKDEGLMDLLAVAPWWVGVGFAATGFITLKFIVPCIPVEDPIVKPMAALAPQMAWVSAVFLLPAAFSALNSARKRKLLDRQRGIESIRGLSWKEFEELLAEAYRRRGYSVRENHKAGPDDGIDLLIQKDGAEYIVQCKQWRNAKVGVKVVREMFGVMTAEHADGVIIVSSGMFTQEAQNFAEGKPIDLIDGQQLEKMLSIVQTSPQNEKMLTTDSEQHIRRCPKCGKKLVVREATRGVYAGRKFWGCTAFPQCRHTENHE